MRDLEKMARLVDALRPWLPHLVVVGGWAHQMYRYHRLARPPGYAPLRTRDADVAFAPSAPLEGDIAAALGAAGFHEELRGEDTPPVARYLLGADDEGFFVEFLAPRAGDGHAGSGRRDTTVAKAGLTAQRLRHLDLLLLEPWPVQLDGTRGFPIEKPARVPLPNPASFIAQRMLIHERREEHKKPQDLLYIHDTLELFAGSLDDLAATWREHLLPRLGKKTIRTVVRGREALFGRVTDVIREAARIPVDRTLRPDRVQAACAYGLERVFG